MPAGNSALISQELDHVLQWALTYGNNLKVNSSKSREMIVYQAISKIKYLPSVHPKLNRVYEITALGVTFSNTLFCGPHVRIITAKVAASLILYML